MARKLLALQLLAHNPPASQETTMKSVFAVLAGVMLTSSAAMAGDLCWEDAGGKEQCTKIDDGNKLVKRVDELRSSPLLKFESGLHGAGPKVMRHVQLTCNAVDALVNAINTVAANGGDLKYIIYYATPIDPSSWVSCYYGELRTPNKLKTEKVEIDTVNGVVYAN
jgi:hypothetical protein